VSPERWRRLEELFETASDMPPGERGVWLDHVCADDAELRAELDAMLRADGVTHLPIERAIAAGHAIAESAAAAPMIGRRIGPYRITAVLGYGGMGSVYAAVRDDQVYKREVAIKVLRNELVEGPAGRERFRRERQFLAVLDHPSIARLIDGGEDPAPYLVMDRIEGVSIAEYCAPLPLEARLRLFLKVCDAVQYAHAHLIVHRDLKPVNILVTAAGEPKLLDFGIAKLLPSADSPTSPDLTRTGLRLMTPDYASPEQYRGDAITTATDIYSLGAILYELVAGHPPHRLSRLSAGRIEHTLETVDPEPPGAQVADLDNIILMALRKDPAMRYRSVEAFADDLSRCLDGRPVEARPATVTYRAGKFLRRHRWAVATAVLALASLTGGLIAAMYQARIAGQRFREVRQLATRFLFDFDESVRDLPGSTRSRELVVRTALEYLNRLAEQAGNDLDLAGEVALAYQRVGEVQGSPGAPSLGRTEDALASFARASVLWDRVLRARPRDAHAWKALTSLRLATGDVLRVTGKVDEAAALFAQAGEAAAQALRLTPKDPDLLYLAGSANMGAGDRMQMKDNLAGARSSFQKSLDLYRRAETVRQDDRYRNAEAVALTRLGVVAMSQGKRDEARADHEQSLRIREELAARHPNSAPARRGVAAQELLVGALEYSSQSVTADNYATAEIHFRKAMAIQQALAEADPNNRTTQADLVLVNMRLCETLAMSRPKEAFPFCAEAIRTGEPLANAGHRTDTFQHVGLAELGQAQAYLAIGQFAPAQRAIESALARFRNAPAEFVSSSFNRMRGEMLLGDVQARLGNKARALEAYGRARASAGQDASSDPLKVRYLGWIDQRIAAA
jgi:tetratricopeptide (TPR) repeat protein/tRNA A-37 threonylcarbamoyl transferase component Bud32